MVLRATCVTGDPLNYFHQRSDEGPYLRVSDVVLRYNHNPKDMFAHLIRIATNSKWSHSALLYLLSDPAKGFDNTFLVEARTKGIRVASWRNEVFPYEQFTIGIKRPRLDWYAETPYEISKHDPHDPEDTCGIAYLRHVRGIALDQINGLYDNRVVYELTVLYAERVAKRHFGAIPGAAQATTAVANLFKKWDEDGTTANSVARFICSGLVQYSFFEALRRRIINDLAIPEHRDAAMSNLSNMQRIIFREDPEGVIADYVDRVRSSKLDLAGPVPDAVLDLLKTAMPADFNNSTNLEWRYVINKGVVWQIDKAPADYRPQSEDEAAALAMMSPEHRD